MALRGKIALFVVALPGSLVMERKMLDGTKQRAE
jgi:hypothetical protein